MSLFSPYVSIAIPRSGVTSTAQENFGSLLTGLLPLVSHPPNPFLRGSQWFSKVNIWPLYSLVKISSLPIILRKSPNSLIWVTRFVRTWSPVISSNPLLFYPLQFPLCPNFYPGYLKWPCLWSLLPLWLWTVISPLSGKFFPTFWSFPSLLRFFPHNPKFGSGALLDALLLDALSHYNYLSACLSPPLEWERHEGRDYISCSSICS